ncbi:serendipity locus protein alpha [Drosophila hydei]|uniref:Serendipity locus protein alpha n=1 Tax=Drosophila hydei TaxID=7224 RepID=A0A6J1LBT9_DROHY|nr:serendipity locus protein alpha [Drosophila hydei]
MDKLFLQLNVCTELIEKLTNLESLNKFCATFHEFATKLKNFLPKTEVDGYSKIHVETIYLCFTQIITCITQLERTINLEESLGATGGTHLLLTRTHFRDRIEWCLRRLQASIYQLNEEAIASTSVKLEDLSFVELLDLALDKLESYSDIVEQDDNFNAEDHLQLVGQVNHIVRHALAFANVALESDKKALIAICETVVDESAAFEKNFEKYNRNERKLEALSLQRALYSVETYLNEALLRLIFSSLGEATYVSELKNAFQQSDSSIDLDKLICDFDINVDRIQQIGVFAIAFTQDVKTKTIIRSCLASLESLDACIVPAFQFQATSAASYHADILENHFKEELVTFRNVVHEIIDSRALLNNYLDILDESIDNAAKLYPKGHLLKVTQMGNVLFEHFQLKVNCQELKDSAEGQRLHQDFIAILRECQAVLDVSIRVDLKRIVKRLKIFYSVLAKLRDLCDRLVYQRSVCNNEKPMTTSTKLKNFSHSFHNLERENTIVNKSLNSLNHESDLLSFHLTEILRIS